MKRNSNDCDSFATVPVGGQVKCNQDSVIKEVKTF